MAATARRVVGRVATAAISPTPRLNGETAGLAGSGSTSVTGAQVEPPSALCSSWVLRNERVVPTNTERASAGSTRTDATSASVDNTSCQERPPSRLRKTCRLRARNQLGTPAARASTSAVALGGPKTLVRV